MLWCVHAELVPAIPYENKYSEDERKVRVVSLPSESSGGDHRQIPITFGMTRRTAPDTPDLAGNPT